MGIGQYILGGALQGLGQGMALKQQNEDLDRRAELAERRQVALENLRSQNAATREEASDKRRGDQAAQSDQRRATARMSEINREAEIGAAMGAAGAAAKKEERAEDRAHEMSMLNAETRAEITKHNATYRDEIVRTEVDGPSGAVFGVTKSGKTINLTKQGGVIARPAPKAPSSGGSMLFDEAAAAPAVTPPIQIGRDANGNLIWPE